MKFAEVVRFEIAYQVRRLQTWLFFVALGVLGFLFIRGSFLADAMYSDFYLNAPFAIASTTVFASLFWFLIAAPVAGEAAARDAEAGIDPLTYTSPISKAEYLGGRFVAALLLNAVIVLGVPLGILVSLYTPGVDPVVVGPFRPAAYLTAYGFIALPNVFVATSIQFAWAALSRRAIASYLGSVVLFFVAYGGMIFVGLFVGRQDLAALLDVFGHIYLTDDLILGWTPIEKNTRLIWLEGTLLYSRLVWLSIALATLAFTYVRFRRAHHTASPWWGRLTRGPFGKLRAGAAAHAPTPSSAELARSIVSVPPARQTFDIGARARQTLFIAWTSFRTLARSRGGLIVPAAIAAIVVLVLPQNLDNMGTPLLPRTAYLLTTFLTTAITNPLTPWLIVPLLTVLWSGELVWREREAGLGEIADAAPVPEWVVFLGKYLALGLVLATWMAFLTLAGVLVQLRMGFHEHEIGLFLRVLFGLQLPEYLLFALLALVVQGVANQKYVGHFATLLVYVAILFAPTLGLRHPLLVYGAGPGWSYSDMRGFGPTLEPWLWFRLYWAAWAFLLAVLARLLWLRGKERGLDVRLQLARRRLTRPTLLAAALAVALVLPLGGFIFYNTDVLNERVSDEEGVERQAEYERRYGRYEGIPQPRLTATRLRVEIHPDRRALSIRGTYRLVNAGAEPIDSVHLATRPGVETREISFDRNFSPVVVDAELHHRIYALATPLQPGDSLTLAFELRSEPRGFGAGGAYARVVENGSWIGSEDVLPSIGYQPAREIMRPAQRREHGLPAQPLFPTLDEARDVTGEAVQPWTGNERALVETVVGTDADQIAIAPGALRRTWVEGGRRYFHYATDEPIGSEYGLFSARYAVHRERRNGVAIELYHHPAHAANVERMLRSVRASLDYYGREFGPYADSYLRVIENPVRGMGAHAERGVIDYGQGFALFDPEEDPEEMDFPFAVMAHEMAHQWSIPIAYAEGAGLLTESFAWYAAMGVMEETYGREDLERLRRFFRQPAPIPNIRQSVPLLRAMDPYAAYRKGPFALYAMSQYAGRERVNLAFRRLLETHRARPTPGATSLDLYRALQAVTPDSLHTLLHDLFAANTYWEFETERVTATRTDAGGWRVTLQVRARKFTLDPAGVETELPMDEWVQVGVFAPTEPGADFGETLYLRMHRIRTGEQTITVTVPGEPSDAGIDPFHLLIEEERFDNVEEVDIES